MAPTMAILALNAGSSSLKFALHPLDALGAAAPARLAGTIAGLEPGGTPRLAWRDGEGSGDTVLPAGVGDGFERALAAVQDLLTRGSVRPQAIVHRVVHGGERYTAAVRIDPAVLADLHALAPLAPLHQPHNLAGIAACARAFPDLPQVACFDTAFHATLPEAERRFALPEVLHAQGLRRYGFHGLSYQYVARRLADATPRAGGRLVMAHLGHGASLCACVDGASRATTMGFSTLDGLMMGTRSGALDPGVLLHLLATGWSRDAMERLLYRESGLLGVSGISADMRRLRASAAPEAVRAIDLFTRRVIRETGAMSALIGGLDALAFTGGIGEHDAALRADVCAALGYLGVGLDEARNAAAAQAGQGAPVALHATNSAVEVWMVPTDEGREAAGQAARVLGLETAG